MTINNLYNRGRSGGKGKFIISGILIALIAAGISVYFMKTKPRPGRRSPAGTSVIVETEKLKAAKRQVIVSAMGTVKPAVSISLKSQVGGKIVWVNPDFVPGGIIRKGEAIIKIDRRDYELSLITKKAELESARYEYRLEQGQQEIARKEWSLLGQDKDSSELDRELALRKPHLKQKEAKLNAAKAAVKITELELDRTTVRAPFNCIVKTALVNIGDQATVSTDLGEMVGIDYYYAQLSIPVDSIKWIHLPGNGVKGSQVKIKSSGDRIHNGRVTRLLSDLEEKGRMARIIVRIDDPLGKRYKGRKTSGSLLLGEYISAEIFGRYVGNVFRITSESLHDGKNVWLMKTDGTLALKEVELLWRNNNYVFVKGLKNGDSLVISEIAAPVPGMKIRVVAEKTNEVAERINQGNRKKGRAE